MWVPRILVVDDELGPRESHRQILKNDYEVILADNGRLAIDYVTHHPVDVALVDIRMPDMDGIEVLKQIKIIRPEIEVIMITAYASLDNAKDSIKYGVTDYLIKPASVKAVQESVKKAVAKRIQRMQYSEKLTALLQISQQMTSSLETQEVKNIIIDWMEKLFQTPMVWLALYNTQNRTVELAAKRGIISEEIQNAFVQGGDAITKEVIATKQTIVVPDIAEDARIEYKEAALKAGIESVVGLPLIAHGNVIGALVCCQLLVEGWVRCVDTTPSTVERIAESPLRAPACAEADRSVNSRFEEQAVRGITADLGEQEIKETTQMKLLTIFANQAAIALENAQLYSDLKHSQISLQRSYEQLLQAQEQLIQLEKLRALGEMSAGIVHNFNNILTGLVGYTSLLLSSDLNDKEMLKGGLNQIDGLLQDATSLIKKLKSYARPNTEKFSIVDMNKVVADAIEFTKPRWKEQAQKKGLTIDIKMELGQIYPVVGIEYQLREVIINLIINSVDAMPEGGRLIIATKSEGENTLVTVSDSGIGMSEEVRKRIFEPFFTTKLATGTGLGLFTSYNIIHHHSGKITCESEPSKGASFTIRLPKAPDEMLITT